MFLCEICWLLRVNKCVRITDLETQQINNALFYDLFPPLTVFTHELFRPSYICEKLDDNMTISLALIEEERNFSS